MKVFIVTKAGYDETSILGVFETKELAQEHIDWCCENTPRKRDPSNHKSQYDIQEHVVMMNDPANSKIA